MSDVSFRGYAVDSWNINRTYEVNTVVKNSTKRYLSKKYVPCGVNIGDTSYWKELEDIDDLVDALVDAEGDIEQLQIDLGNVQTQLTVKVSEDDVPFQFAYDSENSVYGFMVGEVFHPFGGEVIPSEVG